MPRPLRKKPSKEDLSYSKPGANSPPPYCEADGYPTAGPRSRLDKLLARRVARVLIVTTIVLVLYTWAHVDHIARSDRATPSVSQSRTQASLDKCAALNILPRQIDPSTRKINPRWNSHTGQQDAIILRNATLFDGDDFLPHRVDIAFSKGLITSLTPTDDKTAAHGATEIPLYGAHVTPGLVDMHSHHGLMTWPVLLGDEDGNEIHPDSGPLTPFVRALDGMAAYDEATTMIASGGVTSSLIIPGSANVMGGEGTVVKNRLGSGASGEFVVEELLLEHGIPVEERRRYMKMACGENPKRTYGHTRMGNAWVLRRHLGRAKELMEKQDEWCVGIAKLGTAGEKRGFVERNGGFPEELELDSTVGMLRGRVAMHNHCYMPNDFETMLRISHEFGFRVRAFHHAISAWLVPEMLKEYGDNLTIATFAEASLYKVEAYQASLWAGMILNNHGVPVAYKSDHAGGSTNAKYLMLQPTVARYFSLPIQAAMRAVTSIPAKAIDMDHRIGYVRAGYDADIVVWDSHPLSIGATPRQVFIDGVETLDPVKVEASMGPASTASSNGVDDLPVRVTLPKDARDDFCNAARKSGQNFVLSGIRKSFLENYPELEQSIYEAGDSNLTLVIEDGGVTCLDTASKCQPAISALGRESATYMTLKNGYLAPGLTAVTDSLGMSEIFLEALTSNGAVSPSLSPKDPANVDFAKYGITLEGKSFDRARLGGVTRAITAPLTSGGLIRGVSVGILTSGERTLLNGGIFRSDVALHVSLGEADFVSPGSVSMAIQTLRTILAENSGKGNASVYGLVADGELPLVIWAESKSHTQQVILLKKEFPGVRFVIQGGQGTPFVADDLAEADVPVILSHREGPATWSAKDVLVGPPLTRSPASILSDAGVLYAITAADGPPTDDARIHDLALEARWAAKFAGLGEKDALGLVSTNVEKILGLGQSKDIVVWEDSPLAFGTPILAFQDGDGSGKLELATCWPSEGGE